MRVVDPKTWRKAFDYTARYGPMWSSPVHALPGNDPSSRSRTVNGPTQSMRTSAASRGREREITNRSTRPYAYGSGRVSSTVRLPTRAFMYHGRLFGAMERFF